MSTVIAYSREDLVALIKDLRLGEPTTLRWERKTGTTAYRFGMGGYNETVKALANFSVISQDDIDRAYPSEKPGLRTMMKEYRARRRDIQYIGDMEAAAMNAFERRKERIIKNLMRLPKRACN